jgi:hypothetical protein
MVTAINPQALAGSVTSGASAGRAEQLAKEPQTVDDLQAVVVRISAEGAKRSDAPTQAAPSAQELAGQVAGDGDGDGQVTPQAIKASEPREPAAPAEEGSAVSSTSPTYEPADTDEDGTVTPQEQQAYEVKLADEKAAAQAANSARPVAADAAVKTYEAVEQLGVAG